MITCCQTNQGDELCFKLNIAIFANNQDTNHMKKVCQYALIASIVVLVLFLIREIALLGKFDLPVWAAYALPILFNVIFVILFLRLNSISSTSSPIKKPAIIAAIGYILSIICSLIYYIVFQFFLLKGNYDNVDTYYTVAAAVSVISTVLIVIGLFWLSKFFSKGSSQQIFTIILASILVIIQIVSLFYSSIAKNVEDVQAFNRTYNIILAVFNYIPAALFLYAFSKLKK